MLFRSVAPTIANDPNLGFLVRPLLRPNDAPDTESKGDLIDSLNLHRFEVDLTEETIAENTHRWLMADLLEFHKREAAVQKFLWATQISMDDQQFIDDSKALGGLKLVEDFGAEESDNGSFRTRRIYEFNPSQSTDVSEGSSFISPSFFPFREDPADNDPIARANVERIDPVEGIIELVITSKDLPAPQISAGFKYQKFPTSSFENGLVEIAQRLLESDPSRQLAAHEILALRPPRFVDEFDLQSIASGSCPTPRQIADAIHALDRSYLAVQGPPGTGKTYSAAHAILDLVNRGHRVGITANTHDAVHNLIKEEIGRANV